jgi:hypothetical protein
MKLPPLSSLPQPTEAVMARQGIFIVFFRPVISILRQLS